MTSTLLHLLRLFPFLCGGHRQLVTENIALRQQLAVYKRMANRPKLRRTDRLFWVWLSRLWAGWRRPLVPGSKGSRGLRASGRSTVNEADSPKTLRILSEFFPGAWKILMRCGATDLFLALGAEVHEPPGRDRAPALGLQLRGRPQPVRERRRRAPPLRRAHEDEAAGAPPVLDGARSRSEREAVPAGRGGAAGNRGRGLPRWSSGGSARSARSGAAVGRGGEKTGRRNSSGSPTAMISEETADPAAR